ncbi:hypothetical protein A3K48_02525 [candidate division WOR-1 bacterium RIFOXYA12_FULL_52_29]|uniref:Uncharacterized protein n=1 Tax=candidate division WOR-1 bacterium RIFOXYC12_FULL_54_18 TaxID=1802584 RepID=A0A1F4T5M6_UNCSA|nr:MAG: hypothetical protein A3K44_02525 [candidate division WOR-1 bacterium RIFOXYA2_FULL_51_19]OGC17449.1 MAG: hypothetical protein A3K48_02525 [candidate division WOR-1 bacterium RIFOXYA12_FULL_52_29]OGC26307.1 MAG: hypothetical protein A3K32_02520 [candidate division WOR-1 bacterium RIFOXYB2_FULL_45_9]OGC27866.1 MAG: hypothetical protein A3K49_02525 [candidate division WOR-1 bacterium RIFOXYC12_FULL_54_18]OGC29846.1 MAG: hypothetical protein A2346_03810 [candidate division WOR-1 bacterium R
MSLTIIDNLNRLKPGGTGELFLANRVDGEAYLREYVKLIGELSRDYQSDAWWRYPLASKDYYSSAFFSDLVCFDQIVEELKRRQSFIVYVPSRALRAALVAYCRERSLPVTIIEARFARLVRPVKSWLVRLKNRLLFVAKEIGKTMIARFYLARKLKTFDRVGVTVLRTWLLERSVVRCPFVDDYFGALPEYLKEYNLLIVGGVLGNYWRTIKAMAKNPAPLLAQETFLKIFDPLRAVLDDRHGLIQVKRPVLFNGKEISALLNATLRQEHEQGQTLNNSIYYYYARRLAEKVAVERYILTHENYPWEKMSLLAIKRYAAKAATIGYQHSALYPALTNVYLGPAEQKIVPFPDRIITLGEVTADFLINKGGYERDKIKVGCALRFKTGTALLPPSGKKVLTVLGCQPRAGMMIDWLTQAFQRTDYQVVLRPHPASPLRGKVPFTVSNSDLLTDLTEAAVVLYDLSAVGLEALALGRPVVHLRFDDLLSFDPLLGFRGKSEASSPSELLSKVAWIMAMDGGQRLEMAEKGVEFVKRYLAAVTPEKMMLFTEKRSSYAR